MSRIHPAYQNRSHDDTLTLEERSEEDTDQLQLQLVRPSVLTVWKRSSMTFQGTDGFTVFDHHGRLAFRVDNYSRKSSCNIIKGGGLVLMDGAGNALLTLKPQVYYTSINGSLVCCICIYPAQLLYLTVTVIDIIS